MKFVIALEFHHLSSLPPRADMRIFTNPGPLDAKIYSYCVKATKLLNLGICGNTSIHISEYENFVGKII